MSGTLHPSRLASLDLCVECIRPFGTQGRRSDPLLLQGLVARASQLVRRLVGNIEFESNKSLLRSMLMICCWHFSFAAAQDPLSSKELVPSTCASRLALRACGRELLCRPPRDPCEARQGCLVSDSKAERPVLSFGKWRQGGNLQKKSLPINFAQDCIGLAT